MNNGGRIVLLGSAVVLLMVGVVCLKQRLGYQEPPPAFLPGDVSAGQAHDNRVTHQPTILSTDPSSDSDHTLNHPWRDPELIPATDLDAPTPPSFPVRHQTPSTDYFVPPAQDVPPAQADSPPVRQHLDSAFRDAPPFEQPDAVPPTAIASTLNTSFPASVITKQDDSLWSISEQTYGQGDYFRALFALNKDRIPRPDRIGAGIELQTPPLEELRQLFPDLCPAARDKQG